MQTIKPFEQNIIAVIWDFDKTLIDGYMQDPIFEYYGVNGTEFWKEVNKLEKEYKEKGIRVNRDTIYLNHFITCVKQGIFPKLSNSMLHSLGAKLKFYNGIPDIFTKISDSISNNSKYQKFGIKVEHYIVSTGLSEMIKGSIVSPYVKGIWGCEFIETPIQSQICSSDAKVYVKNTEDTISTDIEITQVGYAIDNTSKTRALFEINKGTNIHDSIDVNAKMLSDNRRIPFEHMIYIADGPSDVPAFSILQQYGGKTFAVFPKGSYKAMCQVDSLLEDGRINMYGEADYSENTLTYLWLLMHVREIADRIYNKKQEQIRQSVSKVPSHIIDE